MSIHNIGNLYALKNFSGTWDVVDINANVLAESVTENEALTIMAGAV